MSSWRGISGSPGTMQAILNGFAGTSPCVSQLSCAGVLQRNALLTFAHGPPPSHCPPSSSGLLQLSVLAMPPSPQPDCPNNRFSKMLLNCIWVTGQQLCSCRDHYCCSWSHSNVTGRKHGTKMGEFILLVVRSYLSISCWTSGGLRSHCDYCTQLIDHISV